MKQLLSILKRHLSFLRISSKNNVSLKITPEALQALTELRATKKFVEGFLYPGAPNEEIRLRCEMKVNQFLDDIISAQQSGLTEEKLIAKSKVLLGLFDNEDAEEQRSIHIYSAVAGSAPPEARY